ncbi:Transposase [Cordylochernes scorpioides]|uniref:Transposase n=1 Tax=Cordylochernes scorpioides TaxID=51811 RepID=A0ABY6LFC0_9ARAC|nr:Transposase [Cordylochernes scorpioides]
MTIGVNYALHVQRIDIWKSATEAYQMLYSFYGNIASSLRTCQEWFKRFKSGDFDVNNKEHGQRLKTMGKIQKEGKWLPHELSKRTKNIEERYLKSCWKGFKESLHHIVTRNEKWVDFDYLKRKESWRMPGHRKRRQFKQTDAFTRGMVIGLKRADTLDHSISTRTISRRLVANGLHSCRPLRRLPLTPPNRRQRLEWCRARSTWMTEWHRVVFSDELRFCLSSDSRRVRVWRRRGERSNPAAIVERPTVRQRGIMVWGAIAYDSRSPLLRIQGTMTAQRYVDDVLRPVTLPYLQGVPNALYQQDNARPHTARISQQALQDVQMLPWPPYSPDLSPIEHVWDIIGRRLHALPQPRSEDEVWQMVEREWRAIPKDAIRTLIDSLPRRVAACIAVRGGPTCY